MSQPRLKNSPPTQSTIKEVQTSMLITDELGITGNCMPNSITNRTPQLHVVPPSPAPSLLSQDYQRDFAIAICGQIKEYRRPRHIGGTPNSELRFLCASATQAGKTRAMIKLCKQYKLDFVKPGERLMIIFLAFSAKDVSENTLDDFAEAELLIEIEVSSASSARERYWSYIHPGNSGNVSNKSTTAILEKVNDFRENGGHIIWINDEADHSSGGERVKGSEKYQSNLREWVRQNKIPLWNVHPPSTRKSHEVGIHVTATMAHMLDLVTDITTIPEMRFASFTLDDSYSGLDTLNRLGVFGDNAKYHGRAKLQVLIDLCEEWIKEDQKAEDYCYHILRSQDKKTIVELEKMWKSFGGVVEKYDCSGTSSNIKSLSRRLDRKPTSPTLILLKQGFSRGSRIHTVDHIANCFDSKRNNDAAVIQSLPGRMTGRRSGPEPVKGQDDDRPTRESSYHTRLKIYCDLNAIQKEIPAIEAQRKNSLITHEDFILQTYPGMTGTWCKKTNQQNRKYSNARVVVVNNQRHQHDAAITKLGPLKDTTGNSVALSTQTISKNVKDLAADYLNAPGRYHPAESASNPKKAYISVHADGPGPTPSSIDSWKVFPHQHNYVLVEVDVVLGKKEPVYIYIHGC